MPLGTRFPYFIYESATKTLFRNGLQSNEIPLIIF